jgi:methylamine---corrinoid protein Co-methyltransferase
MSYQSFLETLDKAETGPIYEEKDFDSIQVGAGIQDIVKRFDIGWPRDVMVPFDDTLADRLFDAGLTLAEECGLLCIDTGRRITWTRSELLDILSKTSPEIKLGTGDDEVTIRQRVPDKDAYIVIGGGAYGIPVPEEMFTPMVMSYVQEKCLDYFEGPMLSTVYGRPVRSGSPWESVWCWQEKNMVMDAIARAGRPGISVGAAVGSASHLGELSSTTPGGFRRTDKHHLVFTSELKVNYAELTKAAHMKHTGATVLGYYNPIFGGYGGGSDGMALLIVAGMILLEACFTPSFVDAAPGHAHLTCSSYPAMLPGQAAAFQALSRNTNLLVSSFIRPTAGPCVPQIFDEIAAMVLATAPCGIAHIEGVHTATGRFDTHCSPLETRFMAEITHAAEKITRQEADEVVKHLVPKYKDGLKEIQPGKSFVDCYDQESLKPTQEWLSMYEDACKGMREEYGLQI